MFVDVETTGTDWQRHSIIQVGYVVANFETTELVENGSFLIKPYTDDIVVNPDAISVNNIDLREVFQTGITPHTLFNKWKRFVDGNKRLIFAGWNVWFDYMFVNEMFKKVGLRFGDIFYRSPIDVKSIYMDVFRRNDNLKHASKNLKVVPIISAFHDGEFDALMTYNIWKKLREVCK